MGPKSGGTYLTASCHKIHNLFLDDFPLGLLGATAANWWQCCEPCCQALEAVGTAGGSGACEEQPSKLDAGRFGCTASS